MAHHMGVGPNELKEKGYSNVRYLNAVIQVAKDGSYEITEK